MSLANRYLFFLVTLCFYYIPIEAKSIQGDHTLSINAKDSVPSHSAILFFDSAKALNDQGNLIAADRYFKKAINSFNPVNYSDSVKLGEMYSGFASCLRNQYDYNKAITYLEISIHILSKDINQNYDRLIHALLVTGNLYFTLDNWPEAIVNYQYAEKLADQYLEKNDELYVSIYQGLSESYTGENNLIVSSKYLEKLEILIKTIDTPYYVKGDYYRALGKYHMKKNNFDSALKAMAFSKNVFLDKDGPKDYYTIVGFEYLGDVYFHFNKPDSALFYYQTALIHLVDKFENEAILSNPEITYSPNSSRLLDVLIKKAAALQLHYKEYPEDLNYLDYALETYHHIDQLKDQIRNSDITEASLYILQDYFKADYENGIKCAYDLYMVTQNTKYIESAFHLMEKNKYMSLFESLTLSEKSEKIDFPPSLRHTMDSLQSLIAEYNIKISALNQEDSNRIKINSLKEKKLNSTGKIDSLKLYIRETYPSYYTIKYDSLFKPLAVFNTYCQTEIIQGIEFYTGEKTIYTIVSKDNQNYFLKTDITDDLKKSLHTILRHLSQGTSDITFREDYKEYTSVAYELYCQLIQPVISRDKKDHKKLLIIPDGVLAQLSFGALLTELPENQMIDYSNLSYLIQDYTIGYAYSANLLLNHNRQNVQSNKELLAISYSGSNALAELNESPDKNELPFSGLELNLIKKYFHESEIKLYYDKKATKSVFLEQAPNYRILHLAIHGEADTLQAINSSLRFKSAYPGDVENTLYMHEIYGLNLSNSDLAVLSACETGLGTHLEGEGVFSMAQGFAYAGCPSILMSFWKVNDRITSEIMGSFYKYLTQGESVPESLRESNLDFLEIQRKSTQGKILAHPVNWAAFISIGNFTPMYKKSGLVYYLVIGIGMLVGVALLLIKFKQRMMKNPGS